MNKLSHRYWIVSVRVLSKRTIAKILISVNLTYKNIVNFKISFR